MLLFNFNCYKYKIKLNPNIGDKVWHRYSINDDDLAKSINYLTLKIL